MDTSDDHEAGVPAPSRDVGEQRSVTGPQSPPLHIPWHISSHRPLVSHLVSEQPSERAAERAAAGAASDELPPLDAVVVPAGRSADNLVHAARVARLAGCHLLVLCSGKTDPLQASHVVRSVLPPSAFTVVDLPVGWSVPRLVLRADLLAAAVDRHVDTGAKRNVGLLVSRQVGWQRVLFLDDDVRDFDARHLGLIQVGLAEGHQKSEAVGWAFDDYPDNSMVCHAYRQAGGDQSTFISGGALAVKVSPWTPHFPDIYNEDWMFMLRLMLRRPSALAMAGTLTQVEFDPFAVLENATKQEFGDVLGEGLFGLLHSGRSISSASSAKYWIGTLRLRLMMVRRIQSALRERNDAGDARTCEALDVSFASSRAMSEWPLQLADWVAAWKEDCVSWSDRMASLTPGLSIQRALENLDLLPFRAGCPHGPRPDGIRGSAGR